MNPTNFPDNKRRKQTEAAHRKTEWELMAPDAKLRALDMRPGACKKQRARILASIKKNVVSVPKEKEKK